MSKTKYLLDSNVIIKIWNRYPELLRTIDNRNDMEYFISNDVAIELSRKEYTVYKNQSVLSDRFLKLLSHMLEINEEKNMDNIRRKFDLKITNGGNTFYINGNKISKVDFNLISICNESEEYILVTDDKKLLNSAKIILGKKRCYNSNEFILFLNELVVC
ncbi:hypothetical protein [Clostridium tarantellae]|uniref:PIN domain-containing protein n=1 Tax=Clostridium tarantellae TaxID=39493 RepID=A0A6I1MN36_9CLOT|nr:hypothetical protein [Clostridium tarantellae]MPQ43888.1 hypothetical protein [Clostridium tarantellae]